MSMSCTFILFTAHIPAAIDGKIRITVGALREIVVQGESSDEPLNITVRISSEENQVVYEETFEGITLTGDRDTIAQLRPGIIMLR